MRKIDRLKKEAREVATLRGHKLDKFEFNRLNYGLKQKVTTSATALCTVGGAGAFVNADPPPNGHDITGKAVATNCKKNEVSGTETPS